MSLILEAVKIVKTRYNNAGLDYNTFLVMINPSVLEKTDEPIKWFTSETATVRIGRYQADGILMNIQCSEIYHGEVFGLGDGIVIFPQPDPAIIIKEEIK